MKKFPHRSIGIAIITHNAKRHLPHCLPPLMQSPLAPKIVVVNSSSTDGTVELATEMGVETLTIARSAFNHGETRELARKKLACDIAVMATPDAYATSNETLSLLVQPIIEGRASVAYARQIPHSDAGYFAAFARKFNYPEISHIRSAEESSRYGAYATFCSNAFAAYDNSALDAIGGFSNVLLGEDTLAVSKLLKRGDHIAYVAEATVRHSHSYTLLEEFKRNFDTGLARKMIERELQGQEKDEKRGLEYFTQLLGELALAKPHLIPYAILQSAVKYCGYRLGRSSKNGPHWFKKSCSSQDFYWN